MKVRWDVRTRAETLDIENASQLSVFAGLTYPVATRVWADEELDRIEVATVGKLAKAFKCQRNPWTLLKILER